MPSPAAMRTSTGPGRLRSIQYVRGVAALAVVLTHSGHYLVEAYEYDGIQTVFGHYWSYLAVVAFFSISGFLLTSLSTHTSMRVFLAHRIIRIFPAYLCALAVTFVLFRMFERPIPRIDWRIFLLIPIGPEAFRPLHVEWTLVYEMAYYALLSIFCLSACRRFLPAAYVGWFLVLLTASLTGRGVSGMLPRGAAIYLSGWNVPFICGGVAWFLLERRWIGWRLALLGFISLLTCTMIPGTLGYAAPLGISLLIAHVAREEQEGRWTFRSNILETLGNWSYAMYLIHAPIFIVLFPLFRTRGLPPLSAWFSGLGVVLLATALLGEFDQFVYGKLKKLVDARLGRPGLPEACRDSLAGRSPSGSQRAPHPTGSCG